MPNNHPDDQPVSWGRYSVTMDGIEARLGSVERTVSGWQQKEETQRTEHRTRTWQVILALVSGLVLPLVVVGIIALLHLKG